MAGKVELPELGPHSIIAGIETIHCECGWEACFVVPEELDWRELAIHQHLREIHRLDLPMFTVTRH